MNTSFHDYVGLVGVMVGILFGLFQVRKSHLESKKLSIEIQALTQSSKAQSRTETTPSTLSSDDLSKMLDRLANHANRSMTFCILGLLYLFTIPVFNPNLTMPAIISVAMGTLWTVYGLLLSLNARSLMLQIALYQILTSSLGLTNATAEAKEIIERMERGTKAEAEM